MTKDSTHRYGLGLDLGGTKMLAGVIDLDTGAVLSTAKKSTKTKKGMDQLLGRLGEVAEEALATADLPHGAAVRTIGLAAAGQVDQAEGVLLTAPNLGGLGNIPFGRSLGERFGLPVRLGNDVQGAALGELTFGAARGADRAVCVFVGTGVGGALIQNGRLDSGATGTAGEVGHLVVHADGRHCGCGGRGHLEAYASRTAIARALQSELHHGRRSVLRKLLEEEEIDVDAPEGVPIRSGILAQAVAQGDDLVLEAIQNAGYYLGLGLASIINVYNPQRIILGGGVVEAVPSIAKIARPVALREALPEPGKRVEIVISELGDNAGIVGAALLGGQAAQ